MDGVIILNTITTPVYSGSLLGFCPIVGIIAMLIGSIAFICFLHQMEIEGAGIGLLFFIIGLFAVLVTYHDYGPIDHYNYTYEVVIEDTVDFNDFYDKYEIIDQRGKIYTVTPKNQD